MHGHARNTPSSQDGQTYKEDTTHAQMLVRLYEEERSMGKLEMVPRHKMAERTRKTQTHTHKMLVRLYEEERCMGKPERSLVTRRPNAQGRHTQMLVRLYEEERCMGTPGTLPSHKMTERTRGREQTKKEKHE